MTAGLLLPYHHSLTSATPGGGAASASAAPMSATIHAGAADVPLSGGECSVQQSPGSGGGADASTIPVDVPVFLQNTFRMIDSCDPTIASWWSDGETFVIKDTQKLASEVIPQFFKHNKFSSFVRQLNFYGFRKIKYDPYLNAANSIKEPQQDSKHWRFRHEFFVQGRPDLMREIRRPSQQNAVEREEVESLKKEVSELKAQMAFLLQHIQQAGGLPPVAAATAASQEQAPEHQRKRSGEDLQQAENPQQQNVEEAKRRRIEAPEPSHAVTPPPSPGTTSQQVMEQRQHGAAAMPQTPVSSSIANPLQQQQQQQPQHHPVGAFDPAVFSDAALLVDDFGTHSATGHAHPQPQPQPQQHCVNEAGIAPHDWLAAAGIAADQAPPPPPLAPPSIHDIF